MKVTLASDHAGYDLRMKVKAHLEQKGFEVLDGGAQSADVPFSYVEAGQKIGNDILDGRAERGIDRQQPSREHQADLPREHRHGEHRVR